ncbi:hypothetical protein OIO90_002634 [Microbotryomycetes sp. JL221]|nr:hypothetical protein OIO90_002634 [Microbotryomycetes sp. JL221]
MNNQRGRAGPSRPSSSTYQQPRRPPAVKVNRREVPPTLIRVFARAHAHHEDHEFTTTSAPLRDEYHLFAWRDTTVRELLLLLRDAAPELRAAPLARYSVRHVLFDVKRDRFVSKDVALVPSKDLVKTNKTATMAAGHARHDHRLTRTLAELDFVAGDFLDIAYLSPSGPGGGPTSLITVAGAAGRAAPPHRAWGQPAGGRDGLKIAGAAKGSAREHPWAIKGGGGRRASAGTTARASPSFTDSNLFPPLCALT